VFQQGDIELEVMFVAVQPLLVCVSARRHRAGGDVCCCTAIIGVCFSKATLSWRLCLLLYSHYWCVFQQGDIELEVMFVAVQPLLVCVSARRHRAGGDVCCCTDIIGVCFSKAT